MRDINKLIKKYLVKEYPQFSLITKSPIWLRKCRWNPKYKLQTDDKKKTLVADLILSGAIPKFQYSRIVKPLLDDHINFQVLIITLEENYEDNPDMKIFCEKNGIGLKIVIPGIGLQTVTKTNFDYSQEKRELPEEEGWFPAAILDSARGLDKIGFSDIIDDFIDHVETIGNDEQQTIDLVHNTIDSLLQYHPSFKGQFGQFMKLSNFEKLLKLSNPDSSDHVLHSFRVFLAGCPVINEFYESFQNAHRPFCKMEPSKLRVEYAWFLTAIFHDIGKPKEVMEQFIIDQIDDEDVKISITGNENRWVKEHNITARRVLGSLGVFIVNENEEEEWDGGIIEDEDASDITTEWIRIYDEMKSHAVIGAFDFLGDLFKKAAAAGERKHRPFIITHASSAAISILLHDWKIWPDLRKMKLIPINVPMIPMAALLIYIDTWDNYKRSGENPLNYIREYCVDSEGVCVQVEWGDYDLMCKDEIGYIEYKKALKNLIFSLNIKYGITGTI